MVKTIKKLILLVCALLLCGAPCHAADTEGQLYADALLTASGMGEIGSVLSGELLAAAGTSSADWLAFALARAGLDDGFEEYLKSLEAYVSGSYAESGGLSPARATEWHRVALTVLALGGDPTDFGGINLIADGVWYAGAVGEQGLNGWIWALITADSGGFEEPADALCTRELMLSAILSAQLDCGGFALSGGSPDTDITAMALQALAPYASGAASEAVSGALDFLASAEYESSESLSQTVIALCCLGLDRRAGDAVSRLREFLLPEGGAAHICGGPADMLSSAQALMAIAAAARLDGGFGTLFDFKKASPEDVFDTGDLCGRVRFTGADVRRAETMLKTVSTEHSQKSAQLLKKLQASENRAENAETEAALTEYALKLEAMENEISSISSVVLEKLYPFDSLSRSERALMEELRPRLMELPEYDRARVLGCEELAGGGGASRGWPWYAGAGVCGFAAVIILITRKKGKRYDEND